MGIKSIIKKYNGLSVVAKATLWFIICSILQRGISFITTPIFTRMMSTEQYGQFGVYSSWLNIFTIITTLRLNGAVFNKGMSKYKEDRDTYTSTMQILTLLFAVGALLIYLVFLPIINNLTELPTCIMLLIFLELLFTPAIDFWTVKKRYEYSYKPVVYRTLIMAILNSVLGIVAVYFSSQKGYARIISCIGVNLVFGISLFCYNYNSAPKHFKKEYAAFALKFNLPLLLHYFSQYVLDQFDRVMVQKLVSIAAVGIYGVAYNIGLLLRIVTTSVNNALTPWQYGCLEKKQHKKMDDTMFVFFVVVAGCSFILSAFAPEIMHILASEEYYEGVYVVPPVALGLFFSFMYTTFANIEFYYDKNKFSMYISVAGAFLNVGLNYIGIKLFGYIAAAYTTLICYVLFALGHYFYMILSVGKQEGNFHLFNTKRILVLSAIVLILGVLFILIYDSFVIRYSLIAVFVILGYIFRNKITSSLKQIKHE